MAKQHTVNFPVPEKLHRRIQKAATSTSAAVHYPISFAAMARVLWEEALDARDEEAKLEATPGEPAKVGA